MNIRCVNTNIKKKNGKISLLQLRKMLNNMSDVFHYLIKVWRDIPPRSCRLEV